MSTTTTVGKKIAQVMDVSGLLECTMNHTVSDTTASFNWKAPKMSQEEWNKILAFFKWTYDEHKSESQVRLFVNTRTKEWKAWAFPQKAKTGMTATELNTEETKQQRSQFKESEGWVYFGTVHHHCSASAFQSSTDEQNEKDQDGIHITVGHMDKDQYDIHHRMYIGGFKMLMVKLSDFWDVEPGISTLPDNVKKMLKRSIDLLAMDQMGTPPPAGCEFPDQWKMNVIEEKVEVVRTHYSNGGMHGDHFTSFSYTGPARKFWRNRVSSIFETDKVKAVKHMKALINAMPEPERMSLEECVSNVAFVFEQMDDVIIELFDIMLSCDLTPEAMEEAVEDYRKREETADNVKEANKAGKSAKKTKQNQTPIDQLEEQQRLLSEGEGYGHGYVMGM